MAEPRGARIVLLEPAGPSAYPALRVKKARIGAQFVAV